MSRYLGPVGLSALIYVLVAVVTAGQAVAAEFSWENGTSKISAEADGEQIITTAPGTTKCNSFFAETGASGTGATTVTLGSVTYTDAGKVDQCRGPLGTTATVEPCEFRMVAGSTLTEKASGEAEGTLDIVNCLSGGMFINFTGCTITIKPQTGLGPVIYKTIHPSGHKEHITAQLNISNLAYSYSGILCKSGEATNGTYTGGWSVYAYAPLGTSTDITVT